MRTLGTLLLFLLLFTTAACTDAVVDPPAPTKAADAGVSKQGGVVASATGSGHYTAGDQIRTLAFNAVKKADGSVAGSYQINVHVLDLWFHVDVTCLETEDNTAWIGGIISQTNRPDFIQVGSVSYFYAIDNGEGKAAPADVVSVARINDRDGADEEFCTLKPLLLPPRPVEKGNVQVRAD